MHRSCGEPVLVYRHRFMRYDTLERSLVERNGMPLDNTWMSCRQTPSTRSGISLLPQFNVPPGVTDFSLESKPPSLPPRNCPLRVVTIASIGLMCTIGVYALVSSAAEPVMRHSTQLAQGMKQVVGSAITHANQQAERNALTHYQARQEYLDRRDRRSRRMEEDAYAPHEEEWGDKRRGATSDTREFVVSAANPVGIVPADLPPMKSGKSSLLLRMAALQQEGGRVNGIDADAVHQYFPTWVTNEQRPVAQWNQEAVLKDLVLAVSHLAHKASVDGPQKTESRNR